MLFGEFGIGDGEETGFDGGFGGGVAEAEDGWGEEADGFTASVDGAARKIGGRKNGGGEEFHRSSEWES